MAGRSRSGVANGLDVIDVRDLAQEVRKIPTAIRSLPSTTHLGR
jgi:hypothetical protein